MNKPRLASLLLLSTALFAPAMAHAQESTTTPSEGTTTLPPAPEQDAADAQQEEEAPDVSIPGGEIIVTGQRMRNAERSSSEVISVLSSEQIARTGEGDIAGALGRVTGLSVVGNGYVYVRGLGDRYSLALLNGSPLPSPEPLKRVVPLDLFPTSVIASSLVQKSYSVNFPGEFGGGVINLTTKAVPAESFLTIGGGIGYDSETTDHLGYTYYGSKTDWTGYDNGNRSIPSAVQDYFNSGSVLVAGSDQSRALAGFLINGRNAVVQRVKHEQPNFSASITGGSSFDLGGATLGVVVAGGYSNKTVTRDITQQRTALTSAADRNSLYSDYHTVNTDNLIVTNGLLGLGLEWGQNQIRWTNLYIHDTDKHAGLSLGHLNSQSTTVDRMKQSTAWYERQLMDTQLVGEFKPDAKTEIDLRGGYANTKRLAPFEIDMEYFRTNIDDGTGYGQQFITTPGYQNYDPTSVKFSRLNEDVWFAGADVSHQLFPGWTGTVGYAFQFNKRTNTRRNFNFTASGDPQAVLNFGLLRPDVLYQPGTFYLSDPALNTGVNYNLTLTETETETANFQASLLNHAFYGKVVGQLTDALSLDLGVRWEYAKEKTTVIPIGGAASTANALKNEYFLPSVTLTYEIQPGMQLRANASKTIARPQFRELVYQAFYDPESNRTYRGNPFLTDSQLYNAEARFEWYFAPQQRFSVGGFYKRIDNPIESYLAGTEAFITSYANAPQADLYGAEVELTKYLPLYNWGGFFASRRIVVSGNYTYTKSKLKVSDNDVTQIYGASGIQLANIYFRDGAPLTGQSKHIANLQLGLEDTDNLSQQTILLNYASKRVISRGLYGSGQPDIFENPGFTIDVVIRQGFKVAGKTIELKLEGRNLTGRKHEEYQPFSDGSRADYNTYAVGRVFSASASIEF